MSGPERTQARASATILAAYAAPALPAAMFALAALYAWAPVAAKLAAIALMWRFPLTETVQAELRRRIAVQSPMREAL